MAGKRILIRGGRIWDGAEWTRGDVYCDGNVIARIGDCAGLAADYEYDADGCIVAPGLIDIHMHMRGISYDAFGTPVDACCLPFGVTAAAEASGVQGVRMLPEAFMVRSVIFAAVEIKNGLPDFSIAERMIGEYGDRVIGVKAFFDEHVSGVKNTEPLMRICAYARGRGLKVLVHTSNTPVPMADVLDCLSSGDVCTHVYHGGNNTSMEDGFRCLQDAQARGVIIDNGMAGHVHTDFTVLKAAVECGALPDTLSTDLTGSSAFIRGGLYGLTECMSVMRAMGASEEAVLKSVTSEAARAVGMESEWGFLKEGRRADLCVLRWGDAGFDLTDRAGVQFSSSKGYECLLTVADSHIVHRREK